MDENKIVQIWEEDVVIPTYPVYPPEKSPLFIEKRAYQGSTGKVYPFPITEKIADEKTEQIYHAVMLENEYLRIMVLPQLGGRIQRAFDKTNGYDFVYYNRVIKPALVGLAGPWISGGIEFNWPQHHRPSTFMPVDYSIAENADGSATVYVGEIDRMYGTKGMAAISLYPGKAYIEIKGQLYNPTDFPQTFLWWANPAVSVNDDTYSVFPPDVNAVMDHGKRAVSTFPIATGEYYKCDYSAGVDISRYKNVKVPTSFMAAHSEYDFIGNYDENAGAGLLHVADHHVSPGKKQWTWGNGDFGRTWDRNLTDEDGPYIELMTGVFTDNQPDFSWLKPHEEKVFTQYFMPYKGVGRVGNATKEAITALEEQKDGTVLLKVYTTSDYPHGRITVTENNNILLDESICLYGGVCETMQVFPEKINDCTVTVFSGEKILVKYDYYTPQPAPIPSPAEPMKKPQEMRSTEELFLAALHLEQYRHATYEPAEYYLEGLRRDASDIRINHGYGRLLLRRGQIKESIPYFEAAIRKQTKKNPNPYYGECYFDLGLALAYLGQEDQAFDAFYKSTWSSETQGPGFYWLSALSSRKGEYDMALAYIDRALIFNWHNMKARTLKAALLRLLGHECHAFLKESQAIDPLCMGIAYETEKASAKDLQQWRLLMREPGHNYLGLASDYLEAGLYTDALAILKEGPQTDPMILYSQAYVYQRLGDHAQALEAAKAAEALAGDYCFPNRIEEIAILQSSIDLLKKAPMAHYYLGNLLYDKKQYDLAADHWRMAINCKPDLAMAYRNLSIYTYNKLGDWNQAMEMMENACRCDSTYPRFLLEYDQLCAKGNISCRERLKTLEEKMELTVQRDDLYLRYIMMLNCTHHYEEAFEALNTRTFHPWEGGEGKVIAQYRCALTELAIRKLDEKKPLQALELLEKTLQYPDHLGEGKLPNVPDHKAYYYMGIAHKMLGDAKMSEKYFNQAAKGSSTPSGVLYYNDQPSDYIFYQGLAHRALGNEAAAKKSFHQLISFGERHMFDQVEYDFFAVSLPEIEVFQDDIALRNEQYCNYLRALGAAGLGDRVKMKQLLKGILNKQDDYLEACVHLQYEDRI